MAAAIRQGASDGFAAALSTAARGHRLIGRGLGNAVAHDDQRNDQQREHGHVPRRNALAQENRAEDRRGDEHKTGVGGNHHGQSHDPVTPLRADVADQFGRQSGRDQDNQRAAGGKSRLPPPDLPGQPGTDDEHSNKLFIADCPTRQSPLLAELPHANVGRAIAQHGDEAAQSASRGGRKAKAS